MLWHELQQVLDKPFVMIMPFHILHVCCNLSKRDKDLMTRPQLLNVYGTALCCQEFAVRCLTSPAQENDLLGLGNHRTMRQRSSP